MALSMNMIWLIRFSAVAITIVIVLLLNLLGLGEIVGPLGLLLIWFVLFVVCAVVMVKYFEKPKQ